MNTQSPARRTPEEVRGLLLESARELFATKGYAGTSTREIALRAAVSETLLFRHFGNKAKLFDRAVLDPINEFIHDYVEEWKNRPVGDHTAEAAAYAYIEGFYALLSEHRQLVMALVAARAFEAMPDLIEASPLSALMDELEFVAAREAEERGYAPFDVPVATRIVAGMVMAMTLLDDWLFAPGRRRPSRQRIIDEMVAFMVHGLAHRDARATTDH
ncbi:MAG TPA: helix-turn-helix domain-containing protein [Acidimicrobiia bacterium]|nr:helix-turn-helix domain-containing protein [Acidimicrobiia bacterium]